MYDYHLVSTELREPYEPRACRIVRRLRSERRDDLALLEVEPPLSRNVHGTDEDVRRLILVSRLQGTSLFPVSEWPLAVYFCWLKGADEIETDTVASDNLEILDWGEVLQTGR